ncbi:pseudouridine synthase family protein [Campylobacter canadensis]|uniref:tRNA pseudouridine(55) synthase TruB n=1 Tax=Campylobacter canadensis TaxID=449520 RepID=UPI001556AD11|nr:tRNA pseudouridine(55) synthase TruB [Campylobacter canadensis]MBZ7996878.1 tRNA pseudouridine(55) synthase TruB [Campylobacter canadensis]MBZ7998761.1 tRNA pseudouridine(55) synthase TruB [Campylobacter canadensis]MBZ8000357.1 tRNA pseudouridine(55) synthase TruB [Campylobacter canadensis]
MIFLANKTINISSNNFVCKLSKQLHTKLGYSGTLDPFASGALLCACKKHTKLFRFLALDTKKYQACIWFGASSPSLDNENISLSDERRPSLDEINNAFLTLQGQINYIPPIFSAKKINGIRAYKLARENKEVKFKESTMFVKAKILNYNYPFLSFELECSKGAYVRSYAQKICEFLNIKGTLSALRRLSEGAFSEFKEYDAYLSVALKECFYSKDKSDILLGKKLDLNDFNVREDGFYKIDLGDYFAILKVQNNSIFYELNRIEKC